MAYTKGSDFAPHNMTGASSPAPYVASASSAYGSLPPWMAFNGTWGTLGYWVTNGISTGWLQIDIGAGNEKRAYSYAIRVNSIPEPNRAPKSWTFLGSNNGSDWTELDSRSAQDGWGNAEIREFQCSVVDGPFRYFRLNVTENNGDSYLQCGEFYIYEAEGGGGPSPEPGPGGPATIRTSMAMIL